MNRRELLLCLAGAAGLAGCAGRAPQWTATAGFGPPAALPAPARGGAVPLEAAIASRRSRRTFGPGPLPVRSIGQLLWAAQGITGPDGRRAAPSAGALYPLELYVVTAAQVLHYLPQGHRVEARSVPDLRPALRAAAFGQEHVAAAPAVLAIAARAERTRRRYGGLAEAFVEREVGHAAQNVLLTAAALGLAAVPVGSLDPARCARALALDPAERVRYLIPVGPAG